MSSRTWKLRVRDILIAIESIRQRTSGLTYEAFSKNETLVDSILYKYVVIGEAARQIPEEIQDRAPDVPWRLMNDIRNVIAHEYFQVRLDIVWQGIHEELPLLVEPLQRLLESEAED
ncbi:HepT-like ribonuclease domain-containing protein [Adonisia turfae]|uniref:DUF86 domain-containing protein n=1 Tax=Adonisia turfae CCMR0081 TaxID=2292702 RepID=A0A6M0RJ77_9CYAN|nr:DUF86 domain-containing protein [Adonisia turfae CCMR0081]